MKLRRSQKPVHRGPGRCQIRAVGATRSVCLTMQSGLMLEECLVYLAIWVVVFGLASMVFYRVFDNAVRLRRSAADIARALHAGERWREDIRRATGRISQVGVNGAAEPALHVPQSSGEAMYLFTGTNVLRRAGAGAPWIEALAHVKSSRIIRDTRGSVSAWRWEVELDAGKKKPKVRPMFTFEAAAPNQEQP